MTIDESKQSDQLDHRDLLEGSISLSRGRTHSYPDLDSSEAGRDLVGPHPDVQLNQIDHGPLSIPTVHNDLETVARS